MSNYLLLITHDDLFYDLAEYDTFEDALWERRGEPETNGPNDTYVAYLIRMSDRTEQVVLRYRFIRQISKHGWCFGRAGREDIGLVVET